MTGFRLLVRALLLFALSQPAAAVSQNCFSDAGPDSLYNCGYTLTLEGNASPGFWTHLCDLSFGPVQMTEVNDSTAFIVSGDCAEHLFSYTRYELDDQGDTLCTDTDSIWVLFQDPSVFEGGATILAEAIFTDVNCPTGPFAALCTNSVAVDGGGGNICWEFSYEAFFNYTKIFPTIVEDSLLVDCLAESIEILSESGDLSQSGSSGCFPESDIVSIDPNGDPIIDLTGVLSGTFSELSQFFLQGLLEMQTFCGSPLDCTPTFETDTVETLFPYLAGGHWEYLPTPDSSIVLEDTTAFVYNGDTLNLVIDPDSETNPAEFSLWDNNWGIYPDPVDITVDWVEDWEFDTATIILPVLVPDPDCDSIPPCGGGTIPVGFGVGDLPGSPCPPVNVSFGNEDMPADAFVVECFDTEYVVQITVNGGGGPPYQVVGIPGTWINDNTFLSDPLPYGSPTSAQVLGQVDCDAMVNWEPCECVGVTAFAFGEGPITCAEPCVDLFGEFTTGITGPVTMNLSWLTQGGQQISNNQFAEVCEEGAYGFLAEHLPSGCAEFSLFVVEEVDTVDAQVSAETITCANPTATLTTEVTFGLGPYSYDWVGPGADPGNNDGPAFEASLPGTYSLTLEDLESGCVFFETVEVELDTLAPEIFPGAPTGLPCTGDLFLNIEIVGGGDYEYAWAGPGINPGDENLPNPPVAEPGFYEVTVTDPGNGCSATGTVEVVPAQQLSVVAESEPSCPELATGSIEVTDVTNGLGPLMYQLNDGLPQADPDFSDLPIGNFLVTVIDDLGCTGSTTVTIGEVPPLAIDLPSEWVFCGEGVEISLADQISGLEVDITWPDGSTDPVFQATESGEYTVQVSNACEQLELPFTVDRLLGDPAWQIPNIFTPDGDGTNDQFRILYDGVVLSCDFRIYNRWGEEVFFTDNPDRGWDGGMDQQPLPMEVYVWKLNMVLQGCEGPVEVTDHGEVSLIR